MENLVVVDRVWKLLQPRGGSSPSLIALTRASVIRLPAVESNVFAISLSSAARQPKGRGYSRKPRSGHRPPDRKSSSQKLAATLSPPLLAAPKAGECLQSPSSRYGADCRSIHVTCGEMHRHARVFFPPIPSFPPFPRSIPLEEIVPAAWTRRANRIPDAGA